MSIRVTCLAALAAHLPYITLSWAFSLGVPGLSHTPNPEQDL